MTIWIDSKLVSHPFDDSAKVESRGRSPFVVLQEENRKKNLMSDTHFDLDLDLEEEDDKDCYL